MLPKIWPAILALGWILLVTAGGEALMALVGLADGDAGALIFAFSAAMTAAVAGACILTTKGRPFELRFRDAALLTAVSWFVVPAFAALPLMWHPIGLTFVDAYFEMVSGFTTTGSTVMTGLDHHAGLDPPVALDGPVAGRARHHRPGDHRPALPEDRRHAALPHGILRPLGRRDAQGGARGRAGGARLCPADDRLHPDLLGARHVALRRAQLCADDPAHRRLRDPRRLVRLLPQPGAGMGGRRLHDLRRPAHDRLSEGAEARPLARAHRPADPGLPGACSSSSPPPSPSMCG